MLGNNGRHYKQTALWKRIIKWSLLSLLIIILTVGLAGFIFVYRTLGKIGLNTEVIYEAKQQLDIPMPDEPVNILVMGTDDDPDGNSTRSDTIMLVRVNPEGECLSMLSIPRDLLVEIPDVGQDKINAAFAIGGVPLSIDTVRELTGLPIHHFVMVNYEGFSQAVDAMGGVYVDIDRRYFNDNSDAPWGESYEPIDIYPGYQKLSGEDALAYVRYRHADSDFVRIMRQQYFIQDVKSQSMNWGNFTKIPELADLFASNTTSDISRTDVLSLTKFILSVDKDRIFQAQAPIEEISGNYLVASRDKMPEIIEAFQSPEFEEHESPAPEEAVEELSAETIQLPIEVWNGNGVEESAAEAVQMLNDRGCASVIVGGNSDFLYESNQIYYAEGYQSAAEDLGTLFEPYEISQMPERVDTEAKLFIVVGSEYSSEQPQPQENVGSAVNFEEDSETGQRRWKAADLQLPFDVKKPGNYPVEFDYVDFHPYEINTDDGPKPALKVVAEDQLGNYWGIMETTFKDAPLLEEPSMEKEVEGRTYKYFYAGDCLRYLSWEEGDVVFWITNSLQGSLSEETMVQLALSFKPAQ